MLSQQMFDSWNCLVGISVDFFVATCSQISAAMNKMSEANKDLLEKYRKEVALRRKYHEQLVELKGTLIIKMI